MVSTRNRVLFSLLVNHGRRSCSLQENRVLMVSDGQMDHETLPNTYCTRKVNIRDEGREDAGATLTSTRD